jgi:alpha-galactosidase
MIRKRGDDDVFTCHHSPIESRRIGFRRFLPCCIVLWLCLIAAEAPADAVSVAPAETAAARQWSEAHLLQPDALPFSFIYDGKPSASLLKSWKCERLQRNVDAHRVERTLVFADRTTGLEVSCVATQYQDFPAVEWVVYFRNGGTADTPILENIQALDTSVSAAGDGSCRLHYAEGSHERITDFRPLEKVLAVRDGLELTSLGGRSSDGFLPFFNLALPSGNGVVMAIGWTGQWAAEFARSADSTVVVRAGMERTHLRLRPGEKIRTPAILLMFWSERDRAGSQNLFRKLLLRHYAPTSRGRPVDPPVAFSPHAEVPFEGTSEANMLDLLGRVKERRLPVDYWWIDAGWYDCDTNWARWVGTWQPSATRFPRGLKPVADAARQNGLKFLLWFEPERVMPGTWLHKNHADWLLTPPPATGLPADVRYMANDGFHLLNFGNPDALAWAKKTFSAMIAEVGIDAYRNDFNMYPVYYWRHGEAADRQGINEIRYITGLYDFFDALAREHPGLLLDTCASGGRRIDFEMLRRCLVLTRSDYLWDPVGQQCHTFGLAQWIPLSGIGAASTGSYECRSGMGSHFTLALRTVGVRSAEWQAVKRFLEQYRAIRHLFTGDFYPLSPYSASQKAWLAFQFDRPDLGEGVVQVFRRAECPDDAWTGPLCGLDPRSDYVLTDWDRGPPRTVSGRELREKGLTIRVAQKPGAGVVVYRKIK